MVYFGPSEDLVKGGDAEVMLTAAMSEVYLYDDIDDEVLFSWNNEPKCRE